MNERRKQDFYDAVIPFPRRGSPVKQHDTDWQQLKTEVLTAVREGAAMAEDAAMDEHDRHVIADERAFIARFGFDRPRRYRESLIRLKHAVDLTDREIRLMGFTSSLRFGAHGVQLAASRGIAVFGRAVICLLALQMLYAWLLAAHSSSPAPILVLKLAGVAVMLVSMGWCRCVKLSVYRQGELSQIAMNRNSRLYSVMRLGRDAFVRRWLPISVPSRTATTTYRRAA